MGYLYLSLPTPYEHLQEPEPTTERIVPVKSWNKSRKMQVPAQSRGLEHGWAGSTTRNLTV